MTPAVWADLAQAVSWFDFAILVLDAAAPGFPEGETVAWPFGDAGFVVGLFLGAMGGERVFLIVPQTPDRNGMGTPTDLFGASVIHFPGNAYDPSDPEGFRDASRSLSEMIAARYEESPLQILPSTVLAQGYFDNFLLPVGRTLAARESVAVDKTPVDISGKRFRLQIVLPRRLGEASREAASRFFQQRGLRDVALETPDRAYPFHLRVGLVEGRPVFYDYPTTLRASHEALQMILPRGAGPDGERYSLIEERELSNFERMLGTLLRRPQAAAFRDRVEVIRLE